MKSEVNPDIIIQTLEKALALADKAFCELYNKHHDEKIDEGIEEWINQVLENRLKENKELRRNL